MSKFIQTHFFHFSTFPLLSTPGLDRGGRGKTVAAITSTRSTTCHGDNSRVRGAPLEGPSQYIWWCVFVWSFRCSLSRWRKIGLPLVLGQESRPNFKGLPKVSGIATNHWVFLRCDRSPISS